MQDILPAQKEIFRHIEDAARDVLASYGYQEIGLPELEQTQLFERLVGESTDIVEKEMYTFDDRNGESLTLRPEGTAGCARFAQEKGLLYNQVQRFWYAGAMFRYERPQKGRYRQFEQIGAECFGMPGPDVDAELLLMNFRLWQLLGLEDRITLELNSLGTADCRRAFRSALVAYLKDYESELDEDSRRRLTSNPLRILDSKVETTQALLKGAPELGEFLDEESKEHFSNLCGILDDNNLPYVVNPRIVRGLDYYSKTVFEWVTDQLGAQGTVCGGGRYDGLVEQLGGRPTPGVGFAMGLDRLVLMLGDNFEPVQSADVYVVSQGDGARIRALKMAEQMRTELANVKVVVHCGGGKFKAQLKKADASGASLAVILGEDEIQKGKVGVKQLRETADQIELDQDELVNYCRGYLNN